MGTGMVASRDLEEEDRILTIPRSLWITRKLRRTRYKAVHDWAHEKGLFSHSMARLALLLLLEHQDPDSFFRPYFDALGDPTLPTTLTPSELAEVQDPKLAGWIREQADTLAQDCVRLATRLPARFPDLVGPDTVREDRWHWAYGHAVQRTFTVDHEGDEVWVMLPGMDLCNHASDMRNGYYVDDDAWHLEATDPVERGAPITINYGSNKNSADFLLYYGFVPEGNANDRVHLQLELDTEDPDHAEKLAAIDVLGLDTECHVGADGLIPTSFLNALVLWSLDHETFAAGGKDFRSPAFDAPACLHLARALETVLSAYPTSISADEQALRQASFGDWRRALIQYRIGYKRLLRDAAAALRQHANRRVVGIAERTERRADEDRARYALLDVSVPVGGP